MTNSTPHHQSENAIFSTVTLSLSQPIYASETDLRPEHNRQWVNSLDLDLDIRILNQKIIAYQIRWFSGSWSGWYVPGINDLYQKSWEPLRRVWATFNDHHHRYISVPVNSENQIRTFNELDQELVPDLPGNSGVKLFEGAANEQLKWMEKNSLNYDIELTGHKIIAYQIQKLNGEWSGWIVPGYQDTYQAPDQSWHRWWGYFSERPHRYLYMEVLDRNLYQEVLEESDQPKADDLVLGGQNPPPIYAAVLGRIEDVKKRFESSDRDLRLRAVNEALNYGSQGLDLIIQALKDPSEPIQKAVYLLLKNRTEIEVQQALEDYKAWRLIEDVQTINEKYLPGGASVAISSDGKTLVSYDQHYLTIRELPSGNLIKLLEVNVSYIGPIAITPDNQALVTIDDCGNGIYLKIWNLHDLTVLRTFNERLCEVDSIAISPDGKTLVSCVGQTLQFWDLEAGTRLRTLETREDASCISDFVISPDGQTIVSVSRNGIINIWDLETGTLLTTGELFTTSKNPLSLTGMLFGEPKSQHFCDLAISPDGRTVVTVDDDYLRIWDIETRTQLRAEKVKIKDLSLLDNVAISPERLKILQPHDRRIKKIIWHIKTGIPYQAPYQKYCHLSLAISPDGQTVVLTDDQDNLVKIWDIKTGILQQVFEGSSSSLAISPDGQTVVMTGSRDYLRIWNIKTGTVIAKFEVFVARFQCVAITPDSKTFITGTNRQSLQIWDLETPTLLMLLEEHLDTDDFAQCVAIAPDGRRVVSGHWHNTLKIWDLKTGILLRTLVGHSGNVICVAISSDNRTIVSGSEDHTVRIWDLETGTLHRTLEGHSSRIYSVAISPDNRTIVSSSWDKTVKIWDLETGTLLRTLAGHSAPVYCVAISPNSRTVISGSEDQSIKIWDLETGTLLRTLEGVFTSKKLAIRTDGRMMITSIFPSTLRIWDLETGNLFTELNCHSNGVRDFAMSSDGKTIVSLAEQDIDYPYDQKNHVIQIWKLHELNFNFYQES